MFQNFLDELTRYFDCGMKTTKEALDNTKALLQQYRDKIKTISMLYQWENDKALAIDIEWQKVKVFLFFFFLLGRL